MPDCCSSSIVTSCVEPVHPPWLQGQCFTDAVIGMPDFWLALLIRLPIAMQVRLLEYGFARTATAHLHKQRLHPEDVVGEGH